MTFSICLILVFVGATLASFSGHYIPKSFYVIDHEGHKSDVVPLRIRRDSGLPHFKIFRFRRGGGQEGGGYASSYASASSSSEGGEGDKYNFGAFQPDLVFPGFENFAQNFPAAFGGGAGDGNANAHSFASAHSSSLSGSASGGEHGNDGYVGGSGVGQETGYKGPILFSRIGEDKGTGVKVSGAAQGPRGAFSASSSSIDGDGKIKYSVQSGKY